MVGNDDDIKDGEVVGTILGYMDCLEVGLLLGLDVNTVLGTALGNILGLDDSIMEGEVVSTGIDDGVVLGTVDGEKHVATTKFISKTFDALSIRRISSSISETLGLCFNVISPLYPPGVFPGINNTLPPGAVELKILLTV